MILDARAQDPDTTLTTEVAVIGAGPAGIAVALELEARGRTVLLVESGGWEHDAGTSALASCEEVGYPILETLGTPSSYGASVDRLVGGTSSIWAGHNMPLNELDLSERPFHPAGGWPISAEELTPWYVAAHNASRLGPFDYDPATLASWSGVTLPILGERLEMGAEQWLALRWGWKYKPQLEASSAISLLLFANVTSLAVGASGEAVDHAVVRTLAAGTELTVRADSFVVATGAVQTARLLLASDDVVPTGLGNGTDNVGRWFADHVKTSGFTALLTDPDAFYDALRPQFTSTTSPDGRSTVIGVGFLFRLSDAVRRSEGLPAAGFDFDAEPVEHAVPQPSGIGAGPMTELHGLGPRPPLTAAAGKAIMEQVPVRDSRVTLSSQVDALGMRLPRLDWRIAPEDLVHISRVHRHFAEAIGEAGLGRVQNASGWIELGSNPDAPTLLEKFKVVPAGDWPDQPPLETAYHHMCTTRMAPDPADGVVDTDCRVHEVANLFIAGSSVFPTPAGLFPTLTIVALAIRLAAHLDEAVLP